jgi:hypothetical protein
MKTRIPALLAILALTGCGLPANVVVLIPDENGIVGKIAVHEGASTAELDRPLAAVNSGPKPHSAMFLAPSGPMSTANSPALSQLRRGHQLSTSSIFRQGRQNSIRVPGAILPSPPLRQKACPTSMSALSATPMRQSQTLITRLCP